MPEETLAGKGWKSKDGNDSVATITGFTGKPVVCVTECVEVDIGTLAVYHDSCPSKLSDEESSYEAGKKPYYTAMTEDGTTKGGTGRVTSEPTVDNGHHFETRCTGALD